MVQEGQAINKLVKVIYAPVFNTKIIDNKAESNLRGDVSKERGGGGLVVAVLGEMVYELLISMKPGLGKAGDSIDNFSIVLLGRRKKKNLRLCCHQKYLQAVSSFITLQPSRTLFWAASFRSLLLAVSFS